MVKYKNMKKLKYYTFALLAIAVFVLPHFAFAALELTYPALPGAPALTSSSSLADYIKYVFTLAFLLAGLIGVISMIIAGFQVLLYAGNASKIVSAKERAFNAILGIVILMSTFIILATINPNILNQSAIRLPLVPGVYLVGLNPDPATGCPGGHNSQGGCINDANPDGYFYQPADQYVTDTDFLQIDNITGLYYYCPSSTNGPNLLLWKYNSTDFHITAADNGNDDMTTIEIPCGITDAQYAEPISPSVLSFFWAYRNDGVYYYMTSDCTGIASQYSADSAAQTNSGEIPWFEDTNTADPNLTQQIKSMEIININNSDKFKYGVILTRGTNFQGECSDPIWGNGPNYCAAVVNSDLSPGETTNPDGSSTVISTWDGPSNPFWNAYSAYIIKDDLRANTSSSRNQGLTFRSNNKLLTLQQYGGADLVDTIDDTNPFLNINIGLFWKYNNNSSPSQIGFNVSDLSNPGSTRTSYYTNDGNLDNAIRTYGSLYTDSAPTDECLEYRHD